MDLENTSKLLSYVLRHHPEKANIVLDIDGYAHVQELLAGLEKRRALSLSREELDLIVQGVGDKQRFEFNLDRTMIRAIQGHTVNVDVKYKTMMFLPEFVYHGTTERFIPGISNAGICKMSRHHVHCSLDMDTAWSVATRRKYDVPVVLEISTHDVMKAGFTFYQASNGVVLVDHVPYTCINSIMAKRSTDIIATNIYLPDLFQK